MKVLMYTGAFLPRIGGAELVVHHLAEGLAQLDADITVSTFSRSNQHLICDYSLKRITPIKGLGRFKKPFQIYRQYKLNKLINQIRPDIIHVHYLYPTGYEIVGLKQKMGFKAPIVVTSHGIDIQKNETINYGLRLDPEIEKRILYTMDHVDKLIAISDEVFVEYEKLGVNQNKIEQIPNPIAFDIFSQASPVTKKDFNIDKDLPVLLAVGRNHPKKGFNALLDIVKILKNKKQPVMCVFVGREVSLLKTKAAQLGIDESVMFFEEALPAGVKYRHKKYAPSDFIANFFKIADVYAMTSKIESFGLVTVEAMASSKPVVAMKAEGANGLIKNNWNGVLVDGGNEQFADEIIELLNNPDKRQELGENAKKQAAQYARKRVAEKHMNMYRQLLQTA